MSSLLEPYWLKEFKEAKVDQLSTQEQLNWLCDILYSETHHKNTPTTYYGMGDPRKLDPEDCQCGGSSSLGKLSIVNVARRYNQYQVKCECGKVGPPAQTSLKAVIFWNLTSTEISYFSFPYFDLARFGPGIALDRLERIYSDIYLKLEIAIRERRLNSSNQSKGYEKKLSAYRELAVYASKLVCRAAAEERNYSNGKNKSEATNAQNCDY